MLYNIRHIWLQGTQALLQHHAAKSMYLMNEAIVIYHAKYFQAHSFSNRKTCLLFFVSYQFLGRFRWLIGQNKQFEDHVQLQLILVSGKLYRALFVQFVD